jgi:hypothetical protein
MPLAYLLFKHTSVSAKTESRRSQKQHNQLRVQRHGQVICLTGKRIADVGRSKMA